MSWLGIWITLASRCSPYYEDASSSSPDSIWWAYLCRLYSMYSDLVLNPGNSKIPIIVIYDMNKLLNVVPMYKRLKNDTDKTEWNSLVCVCLRLKNRPIYSFVVTQQSANHSEISVNVRSLSWSQLLGGRILWNGPQTMQSNKAVHRPAVHIMFSIEQLTSHIYKYKLVTHVTVIAGNQFFCHDIIAFNNTIISFHSFMRTLSSFEILSFSRKSMHPSPAMFVRNRCRVTNNDNLYVIVAGGPDGQVTAKWRTWNGYVAVAVYRVGSQLVIQYFDIFTNIISYSNITTSGSIVLS